MFARTFTSKARRRGVVLIVVLGMLGLLAVIGFTFATFANQAMISARNILASTTFPDANELMDYALGQLIDDSYNPQSVIRGHGLKRDMYGNDATSNSAFLNQNLVFTSVGAVVTSGVDTGTVPCQTNIPINNPAFYPFDYRHWIVRIRPVTSVAGFNLGNEYGGGMTSPPAGNTFLVGETMEIVDFDRTTGPTIIFYIRPPYYNNAAATEIKGYTSVTSTAIQSTLPSQTQGQYDPSTLLNATPTLVTEVTGTAGTLGIPLGMPFDLDGRYRYAFNGPGLSTLGSDIPAGSGLGNPRSITEYGNFRYNGNIIGPNLANLKPIFNAVAAGVPAFVPTLGNPDVIGMDEDYDAADLENWFLAIQSADGQMVIPSFHRPGILSANPSLFSDNDWTRTFKAAGTPAQQYQALRAMSRILRPRAADGHSPESFPDLLPDSTGKITYDVDNDGDGSTDSVWLDLGYPPKRDNDGKLFKPLFAFMVIGLNGRLPLNTAGNLSARDIRGVPQFDHADHLGNSPSEIDLRYALQNGFDGTLKYSQFDDALPNPSGGAIGVPTLLPNGPNGSTTLPNGIPVALTQLRTLLTGQRPFDTTSASYNGDNNVVYIGDPTKPLHLPNGIGDSQDTFSASTPQGPTRLTQPVAGRWGEEDAIPGIFEGGFTGDVPGALLLPNQTATLLPGSITTANPAGLVAWQYVDFNNPVRAGHSVVFNTAAVASLDARDDNYNTTDFYPPWSVAAPETADRYDDSGSLVLPVERIRRFVTPIDLTGDGTLVTYDLNRRFHGAYRGRPQNLGANQHGHVTFFEYFRPPGLPLPSYYNAVPDTSTAPPAWPATIPCLVVGGYDSVLGTAQRLNSATSAVTPQTPFYDNWTIYKSNPLPAATPVTPPYTRLKSYMPVVPSGAPTFRASADWVNSVFSNNPYHGYGAALAPPNTQNLPDVLIPPNTIAANPIAINTVNNALFAAGMPIDVNYLASYALTYNGTTLTPAPPLPWVGLILPVPVPLSSTTSTTSVPTGDPIVPTFTSNINSKPITPDINPVTIVGTASGFNQQYNPGSYGLNEADEMNLYTRNRFDASFGPSDLEWLYRAQDVDGAQLNSRLSQLAPVSFTNSKDGTRRRRLFALDTWEMNNLVVANDNPSGAFGTNSRYTNLANTAMENIGAVNQPIANRGRKINLNFPLPVSNSPVEPIRQKWVRETYTMLKNILPARAVDTPEELAQLSQYVVNMVDFRDPDAAMTKFVNTDVVLVDGSATLAPTLAFNTTGLPALAYDCTIGSLAPAVVSGGISIGGTSTPAHFLIQYGMEFQPVAINEVLAMRFVASNGTTPGASPPQGGPGVTTLADANHFTGFYFELENMLVKDQVNGTPDTSDMDLGGWDMVIMPDDGTGRPNPITGQIPDSTPVTSINAVSIDGTGPLASATLPAATPGHYTNPDPQQHRLTNRVQATALARPPVPTPLVIGGVSNGGTGVAPVTPLNGIPTTNIQTDKNLAQQLAGLQENTYYWLYLRRPPNPFDARYDYNNPNGNRVVVDSFRFIYTTSRGNVTVTSGTVSANPSSYGSEVMFSLQRMQPYRGGQAVPPLSGVSGTYVTPAYGFSEQTQIAKTQSSIYGAYGATVLQTTSKLFSSLGAVNATLDQWDYFPFNDRDYTSPIELLMVPGTAPGLFTKQFAEVAPPIAGTMPIAPNSTFTPPQLDNSTSGSTASFITAATAPPYPVWSFTTGATPTLKWAPPNFTGPGAPHTNPYLNDEFFYTGSNEHNAAWKIAGSTTYPGSGLSNNGTIIEYTWPQPSGVTWPSGVPNTTMPFAAAYPTNLTAANLTAPANWQFNYIGGPSGAGWHRMLDLFEVPSPAFGAIGPVALGSNYDWLRQDIRPGLLNLNLIVDEEVFLGLMGGSLYGPAFNSLLNPQYDYTTGNSNPNFDILNSVQLTSAATPLVTTMVDDNGSPIASYNMPSVGIVDTYWDITVANAGGGLGNYVTNNHMKASFSDFLKLRHGGSGYVFAYGTGQTGQTGAAVAGVTQPVAPERPFRTLSFPDIDYTILRPATLPPSTTTPVLNPATALFTPAVVYDTTVTPPLPINTVDFLNGFFVESGYPTSYSPNIGSTPNTVALGFPPYTQDPGVKNPYLFTRMDPVQPAPIPPRRLFQIPDYWGTQNTATFYCLNTPSQYYLDMNNQFNPASPFVPTYWNVLQFPTGFTLGTWTPSNAVPPSNASSAFNYDVNGNVWNMTGDPAVNNQVPTASLSRPAVDLTSIPITTGPNATNPYQASSIVTSAGATVPNLSGSPWIVAPVTLGSSVALDGTTTDGTMSPPAPAPAASYDQRDHPYYRSEWLQKIANLTTVRTHQFAVWVTVGFFEVTRAGNPALAASSPGLAYDQFGLELGKLDGKNIRYRAFFLLDRTKVGGFNPSLLEDFRNAVVYRQIIE